MTNMHTFARLRRSLALLLGLTLSIGVAHAADTVTYYHTDALGTPVMESDAAGVVTYIREHKAYGEQALGATKNGPGFTGHIGDVDTGLIYMQARYYDPLASRFLSADPVPADVTTGGNYNRYWYASNNPYRFTDPDGRLSRAERKAERDRKHDEVWGTIISIGTWGGRGASIAVTAAAAATAAGAAAIAYSPSLNESEDPPVQLWHGTSVDSGLALLNGVPLSLETLMDRKIDGPPGFYLASHPVDAEYFAARREGIILQYTIAKSAFNSLASAGAHLQPIPPGKTMRFEGMEWVVPPTAFPLFDSLRQAGKIRVAPYNPAR